MESAGTEVETTMSEIREHLKEGTSHYNRAYEAVARLVAKLKAPKPIGHK